MHVNAIGVVATTDVAEACKGVNIAVMLGGFPRKEGMERRDVMSKNVSIYKAQASALEKHAAADCKVRNHFVSLFRGSSIPCMILNWGTGCECGFVAITLIAKNCRRM